MATSVEAAGAAPTVVVSATAAEAAGAGLRVAGLTVVERALKQLSSAAVARVIVAADGSVALPTPLPARAELRPAADAVAVAAIARAAGDAPVIGADVVRIDRGRLDGGLRVVDEQSRRAAEDAVFAALFRPDLGFVARYVNKPLSTRITRAVLVRSRITPNQITIVAAALGVLGCALVATGRFGAVVAGLALAQIQSLLDGCDGELARVRFQQSKLGAWLDTFVDDVLNVLMTAAAGVGLYRAGAGSWALVVGVGGGAMLVLSNVIIMRDMRRQRASGDLMDMTWWFSGGRRLGELSQGGSPGRVPVPSRDGLGSASRAPSTRWPGIGMILFTLGRRDTAILLWLVFAACNQLVLVLVMAGIIALAWFVASVVQLVVAPEAAR